MTRSTPSRRAEAGNSRGAASQANRAMRKKTEAVTFRHTLRFLTRAHRRADPKSETGDDLSPLDHFDDVLGMVKSATLMSSS